MASLESQTTMSLPQTAVLTTPELLTDILLHLPLLNLLHAQRICKSWNHIIISTPSLQRALFFSPEPDTMAPRFNPLLKKHFPMWFSELDSPTNVVRVSGRAICDLFEEEIGLSTGYAAKLMREEASWRKMLVIQPPVKHADVQWADNGMGGSYVKDATVKFKDGLKMGVLWDISAKEVRNNSVALKIEWRMFELDLVPARREAEEKRAIVARDPDWSKNMSVWYDLQMLQKQLLRLCDREVETKVVLKFARGVSCVMGVESPPGHSFPYDERGDIKTEYGNKRHMNYGEWY